MSIREAVEFAFDYRGNTTVVKHAGPGIGVHIFNRDSDPPEPCIQIFDEQRDGPSSISHRDIAAIRLTGKDTAACNGWTAWAVELKAQALARALRLRGATRQAIGSDAGSLVRLAG